MLFELCFLHDRGVPFITMMLGTRICHLNRFMAPQPTLKFFTDYNVTYSSGVPTIWQGIRSVLKADPSLGAGLNLKRLTCGGSAPAPDMVKPSSELPVIHPRELAHCHLQRERDGECARQGAHETESEKKKEKGRESPSA